MRRLSGLGFTTILSLVVGMTVAAAAQMAPGRVAGAAVTSARMPTMPILPINTIGNVSVSIPSPAPDPVTPVDPGNPNPGDPDPGKPGKPGDKPNKPGGPNGPGDNDGKCRDGGVQNSEYTVDACMNEILSCVNGGALPNGLNDLFNEDLRNSIFNGMNLCSVQVNKCVTTVRVDCEPVYRSPADVWWDFNSRKVQPEYYSFILRKTGLTPHQAENTCWLLDKNTYGPSFAAVANGGSTTAEYNSAVGAYNNQQGGVLVKNNPQGARVNDGNPGVDGQRGHYARWDAATGECLIRVAAYNKDNQITNKWLFGAAGDDRMAEVWRPTGSGFTCNKDLFGFSLMPKTNTTAVVGIGGGTLVGAGIGALAGHGARAFDCENNSAVRELSDQLRKTGRAAALNQYIDGGTIQSTGNLTVAQCRDIINLYDIYQQAKGATCGGDITETVTIDTVTEFNMWLYPDNITLAVANTKLAQARAKPITQAQLDAAATVDCPPEQEHPAGTKCKEITATFADDTTVTESTVSDKCFHNINIAKMNGTGIYCHEGAECITKRQLDQELSVLRPIMDSLTVLNGEKSTILPSTLTGAGIGAGAGGLATAITAFVEKNNINCRVGDGLEQASYGKSHSLGSLRDYYVKWNLRLPDTIMPTGQVADCSSWKAACATLTNMDDCRMAQINYKPAKSNSTTLVRGACMPSGTVCIENSGVTQSHRACKY